MKEILLYGSIIFNVLTNISFKYSALNDSVPAKKWGFLALGLLFGLINSVLFTEALKTIQMQVASAIFFAITIIGLALSAYFIFQEEFTVRQMIGISVIIVGVVMVSLK